jgi:hypothetical protein
MKVGGKEERVLWWSQLVISPLWAQELSFERPLEIASTHTSRQLGSFLRRTCLWILLPPPCHAHPIVQPAFRHAFILQVVSGLPMPDNTGHKKSRVMPSSDFTLHISMAFLQSINF